VLTVAMLSSETFAQSNLRIFDDIGGGGSTTQTEESNDNSTIYIVGGLVIAGILAYALFFKEKKEEVDTTAALSSPSTYSVISNFESTDREIQKLKDQMPVDIFMGVRNNEAILNDRIYQVGLRLKL
jgi:hypothetical protein